MNFERLDFIQRKLKELLLKGFWTKIDAIRFDTLANEYEKINGKVSSVGVVARGMLK